MASAARARASRRTPVVSRKGLAWRLLAVAGAVVVALLALSASGVGLPGPPVRQWLGVGDPEPVLACSPGAERVVDGPGDPPPGTWRTEPGLAAPGLPELAGAVLDGIIYLAGGQGWDGGDTPSYPVDTLLAYEPGSGHLATVSTLPVALDHGLLVAYRGDLYLAGGLAEDRAVSELWRFSPSDGSWEQLPSMRQARGGHAGAVIGDRLYVVGGGPDGPGEHYEGYATLEIFDFETRTWTIGPDMPTGRHHVVAAALGGQLYVAGGRDGRELALAAFERYDPATSSWEELEPLPLGLAGGGAVATSRAVILSGGGDDAGWQDGGGFVTGDVRAYVPGEGWRLLPDLGTPRHGHASAVVGERLFVLGGAPCPGFGRTPSVESVEIPRALR